MGKRTIAEFVESAEILRKLAEFGIDFAQGFHVGRPEPIAEAIAATTAAAGA
jgi:EAL domain-containing protein (putative c-di-GMP-specific phosphodiesterase class I)